MLQEYLHLWTETTRIQLNPDVHDSIAWSREKDGFFSTRTAYDATFWGREVGPTIEFTWRSRAPLRCRFFAWLALQNKCWTSDQLARCGLDHQERCPFYNQEEETINHLILDCMFARGVWTVVCGAVGKPEWALRRGESISQWCTDKCGTERGKKDARAILTLVVWELWKHHNAIVFDGATPSMNHVILRMEAKGRTWKQAGILKGGINTFLRELVLWVSVRS